MNNNCSLTHRKWQSRRLEALFFIGTGDYMCTCSMYIINMNHESMSGHSLYSPGPQECNSSVMRVGQLPNKEIWHAMNIYSGHYMNIGKLTKRRTAIVKLSTVCFAAKD